MVEEKTRIPVVAGQFYPASEVKLKSELNLLIKKNPFKKDALFCLMPHAGYMYSGRVAGEVISKVKIKKDIVILGPNHTGYGEPFSVMASGKWHTPLGDVLINSRLAESLIKNEPLLSEDYEAHRFEHSIEVEIPFLQYLRPDIRIVPIVLADGDIDTLESIGLSLARTLKANFLEKDTLIIASSDMTHYESAESAKKKDMIALDDIVKMDERKLFRDIKGLEISMCGWAPVVAGTVAAKTLGAKQAEVVIYQTSGDITGDYNSVVGYAGVIMS